MFCDIIQTDREINMNKKPGLLYSVYALAVVILMTVFHVTISGTKESAVQNTKNIANYLFVCPTSSNTWDSIADVLGKFTEYMYMGVSFMIIVLLFSWGWALYQNLLKDKFNADVYKTPWTITKIAFWITIVFIVLSKTPNYYRPRVEVNSTSWVLCESTSENARAVRVKNNI